jgi:prevent-host-death family protein
MHRVDLREAEGRLAELIAEAADGEDVVITRSDGASFKIVPVARSRPKFGSARGLVEMSEDFDEPIEDFEAYAP